MIQQIKLSAYSLKKKAKNQNETLFVCNKSMHNCY